VSSAAQRQAAYKRRQRHGEAVLASRCEYFPLIEALLASGRLTDAEALDRGQVESAASESLCLEPLGRPFGLPD
jgi:hypothetical protein